MDLKEGADLTLVGALNNTDNITINTNTYGIAHPIDSSIIEGSLVFSDGNGVSKNVAMQEDVDEQIGDVTERLADIEKQILIVRHDKILAEEFDELQEAYDNYQETLERIKTFQRLRDSV